MINEEANNLIKRLSEAARSIVYTRTLLESSLFPVQCYMALGLYNLVDREYELIKEILRRKTAEEVGRAQKVLNSEINQKTQFSIMVGYLVGREQVIIDGNLEEYGGEKEDADRLKFLLDFWKKSTSAYRNDGNLLAADSNGAIRILDDKTVDDLNEQLISVSSRVKRKIKRMAALLQSYLYLANCESRGGVFNHGPYEVADNEVVVVREFIHLRKHDYCKNLQTKPPYSNIAVAMRLKGTKVSFSEVGTIFTDPVDYTDNITALNLFTKNPTYGTVESIEVKRAKVISKLTEKAQMELFEEITKWNQKTRILAGALQYSDLSSYAKVAGVNYKHILSERCTNYYLPKMLKMDAHPFMHKFSTEEQLFSPIS